MLSGYPQSVRKRLCKVFGHVPVDINYKECTARCAWCGAKLNVSYDMYVGETIIVRAVEK